MPTRRLAHVAVLSLAVASAGCAAVNHPPNVGPHRAPANAPANTLAPGRWFGEIVGSPPAHRRGVSRPHTARAIEVEVTPVRDSASVVLLLDAARATGGNRTVRLRPYKVEVDEDVMTFALREVMGWEFVRCRLVLSAASSSWDGPCVDDDGVKAITLVLVVPPARRAT